MLKRISRLERSGQKLSTGQKILLAETGTVEQVLSILVGSRINVAVSKQVEQEQVILREVVLTSKKTGTPLIHAYSKIYKQNLPASIIKEIRRKNRGIGTIMSQNNLETFRRIVRIGFSKSGMPYRVYRIVHGGKVAFEIREEILVKGGPGGI